MDAMMQLNALQQHQQQPKNALPPNLALLGLQSQNQAPHAAMLLQQQALLQQQNKMLRELLLADTASKLCGLTATNQGLNQFAASAPFPTLLANPSLNTMAAMMLLNSNQLNGSAHNNNNNNMLNASSLNAALLLNQQASLAAAVSGLSNTLAQNSQTSTPTSQSAEEEKPAKTSAKKRANHHSKGKTAKRAKPASSEDEEELETETASEGEKRHSDPDLMHGERRLTIQFDSLGTRGVCPQSFGRGSCVIPDGLSGRHTLYGESWRFCVKHESYDNESGLACVTWSMTSLASNRTLTRTETVAEARKREMHGRTIANQVVKKALEMRAVELEARLACEQNETWRLHLKGKIDALRPARFTQGPLAFGLHHKAVQDRMKELLANPSSTEIGAINVPPSIESSSYASE